MFIAIYLTEFNIIPRNRSLYFTPSIHETAVTSQYTNVSLDCSAVESLLRHQHKVEPCGRKAYLSTFTHQVNSTCSVSE